MNHRKTAVLYINEAADYRSAVTTRADRFELVRRGSASVPDVYRAYGVVVQQVHTKVPPNPRPVALSDGDVVCSTLLITPR